MRGTHRRLPWALALAIATASAVPGAGAPADTAPTEDDGASAPANCWLEDGGCAARTGASHTEALRGPVEVAWTRELGKEIRGDPLVYGSRVFVETVTANGSHSLVALRLADGAVLAEIRVGSSPLHACLAQGVVAACGDKDLVQGYRLVNSKFTRVWGARAGATVESMATVGGELYVRTRTSLLRFDVGGSDVPVWRCDAPSLSGPVTVRGNQVMVIAGDRIEALDRRTGSGAGGPPMGTIHGDSAGSPQFTVTHDRAFVIAPGGFPAQGGGVCPCANFARISLGADVRLVGDGLGFQLAPPIEIPGGWIAPMSAPGGAGVEASEVFLCTQTDGSGYVVAKAVQRREWTAGWRFASYAGGVILHPAGAVDAASRHLLWTLPVSADGRIVPARERVLFVHGKSVVAVGPSGSAASASASWAPGLPSDPVDGSVLFANGTAVSASLKKEGDGLTIAGKPPRHVPLEQVLLAQDAKGAVLHAAPSDAFDDALSALERARRVASLEPVMTEAIASRDTTQLERLVTLLAGLGGRDELIRRADSRSRDLRTSGKERQDPALAAKVDAALALASTVSSAGDILKRLAPDAPRALVVWLCRRALDVAPKDEEAARRVRALLPAGMVPAGPFDARGWVDVAELVERVPIEVIRPPAPGTADLTRSQRALGVQVTTWRRDLIGLKSPDLLVITPLSRPDAIARCIAFGTLACDTVQSWCTAGTKKRDTREPLTLLVYENQAEYQAACRGRAARVGHDLSWTGGHYSPSESLCRLYLPEDDVAMRRGLEVFVHELTHHWVEERCPLFGDSERKTSAHAGGYWIVEGFADFVENLRFDPAHHAWGLDAFAEPLEVVVGAPRERLIPWDRVFDMDYEEFIKLNQQFDVEIAPQRSFVFAGSYSQLHLFYMQSSAVCRYLFDAEGGKLRPKLLEYLADQYCGRTKSIPEYFGMPAAELGAKVLAFCEATLRAGK